MQLSGIKKSFKSTRYEHMSLSPSHTQSANSWFYYFDFQTVPTTALPSEPYSQLWPNGLWEGLKDVPLHVLHKPVAWKRTESQVNEGKAAGMNLTSTCPVWPLSWAVPAQLLGGHIGSSSPESCQSAWHRLHDTHGTWHPVQCNGDPTSLFCTCHRGIGRHSNVLWLVLTWETSKALAQR